MSADDTLGQPSRLLLRTPDAAHVFAAAVTVLWTLVIAHFADDIEALADVDNLTRRASTLPLVRGITMLGGIATGLVLANAIRLPALEGLVDYAARCRSFVRSLDAHSMAGVSEPPSCLAGGVTARADVAPIIQRRPSRSVSFEPRPVDDEDAELRAVAAMLGVA